MQPEHKGKRRRPGSCYASPAPPNAPTAPPQIPCEPSTMMSLGVPFSKTLVRGRLPRRPQWRPRGWGRGCCAYVSSGHEPAFEGFPGRHRRRGEVFPGYLGSVVFRPASGQSGAHRIVYRFDSPAHLRRWLDSDEHATWMERAELVAVQPGGVRVIIQPGAGGHERPVNDRAGLPRRRTCRTQQQCTGGGWTCVLEAPASGSPVATSPLSHLAAGQECGGLQSACCIGQQVGGDRAAERPAGACFPAHRRIPALPWRRRRLQRPVSRAERSAGRGARARTAPTGTGSRHHGPREAREEHAPPQQLLGRRVDRGHRHGDRDLSDVRIAEGAKARCGQGAHRGSRQRRQAERAARARGAGVLSMSRPEHVARQPTKGKAGPRPASTTRSRAGSPPARHSVGAAARRPEARSAPRPPELSRSATPGCARPAGLATLLGPTRPWPAPSSPAPPAWPCSWPERGVQSATLRHERS
jgi:heme-degrading monooxygenase HmoA